MTSMKYLLSLAIVATLASTAFAVHCYQCESAQNSRCGSNFEADESMKVDCSTSKAPRYLRTLLAAAGETATATGCMRQTLESKLGGIHTLRSCYFGDVDNTKVGCQIDPTNVLMTVIRCDVCTDNFCNGSSVMAPVAMVIVAIFCLTRIFS